MITVKRKEELCVVYMFSTLSITGMNSQKWKREFYFMWRLSKSKMIAAHKVVRMPFQLDFDGYILHNPEYYKGSILPEDSDSSHFQNTIPVEYRYNFITDPVVVVKMNPAVFFRETVGKHMMVVHVCFKIKLDTFSDVMCFIETVLAQREGNHTIDCSQARCMFMNKPKAAVRITYRDYILYESRDELYFPFHHYHLPFVLATFTANYSDSRIDENQSSNDFVILPRVNQSGNFL